MTASWIWDKIFLERLKTWKPNLEALKGRIMKKKLKNQSLKRNRVGRF